MFKAKENEPSKKGKLYGTILMLFFSVLLAVGGRIYAAYEGQRQEQAQTPQLGAKSLVLDLRLFAQKKNRFPADWVELEDAVWRPRRNQGREETPKMSVLSHGNRLYLQDNYLYFHTFANDKLASFWAIPRGIHKAEAQTIFVLAMSNTQESWRGPALSDDLISKIPQGVVPTYEQMALLGMTKEQPQPRRRNWLSNLWPF